MYRRTPEQKKEEFEAVALPHLDALYNFALKMTRNPKDAEDLVQDAYVRAFRFFDHFEPGTNCRAWLFRILKNVHINSYRKARRTPDTVDWDQVEDFYESLAPDEYTRRRRNAEEQLIDATVDPEVENAIAELPDEYRAVVILNFVEEMSYKEIAQVLEIPMGTVMSRLHRARKILQRRLQRYADSTRLFSRGAGGAKGAVSGRVVEMDQYRKTGEAG